MLTFTGSSLENFFKSFHHICLPSQLLYDAPHLSILSFSQRQEKNLKIKINKSPVRQKIPKQSRKKLILFVLANRAGAWGLPWSVVDISSVTPLEQTDFHNPTRYQLQITSWVELGLCVHFPFSILGCGLVWTCTSLPRAVTDCWVHMGISLVVPGCRWLVPLLPLLSFSPSLFYSFYLYLSSQSLKFCLCKVLTFLGFPSTWRRRYFYSKLNL